MEGAIEGRSDLLKERSIGISVFERPPDYDTSQDPVVRNTAGQVRKRLAQYYCEPGRAREVRIDLPPGSYVPEVYKTAIEPDLPRETHSPGVKSPRRWWPVYASAAVATVGLAGFALWRSETSNPVDHFWAPLLRQPGAIVLCVGQGHTYKLNSNWDRRFEDDPEVRPGEMLPLADVVPSWDRYIGINDAQTAIRLTNLFGRHGKSVQLLGGRSTTLADLRHRPAVLIGALNNDWTLSFTGELRFYFHADPEHKVDLVLDRQHPDQRSWGVRSDAKPSQIATDYAIITRVYSRATEQTVVVAAGIKGAGTYAAGEFLTNPAYLSAGLRSAPRDWDQRNVQFVLATRMYSGSPGPATVVAAYYW